MRTPFLNHLQAHFVLTLGICKEIITGANFLMFTYLVVRERYLHSVKSENVYSGGFNSIEKTPKGHVPLRKSLSSFTITRVPKALNPLLKAIYLSALYCV